MSFVVYRAPNPSTQPKPQTLLPDFAPEFTAESEPQPVRPTPRAARTLGAFASRPSGQLPAIQKPPAQRPPMQRQSGQMPSVRAPSPAARATAPRVAVPVASPKPAVAAPPTTGDYLRLAGFALAGGVIAALYVVLPLIVLLRSTLPWLPNGFALLALALTLVALGEMAVVRILLHTTPKRQTVAARPRRTPAFSGPLGFDVELSALNGNEWMRGFPALARGIPAGPDSLIVRVGSARWRDYQGPVTVSAYLPQHVIYAHATILRAEDAPIQGKLQFILHLRLSGMSAEDTRAYRDVVLS